MQAREVMQARRESRGFKEFAVISVRKVTQAVKVLRVIWARRDRLDLWDRLARQVRRVMWVRRGRGGFRARPVRLVQRVRWAHRV